MDLDAMVTESRFRILLKRILARRIARLDTRKAVACLENHVASALGLSGSGEFERMQAGANTTVFRWRTECEGVLYARLWRWKRQDGPVRQHQEAVSLLGRAGLRTPELLFADDSTATIARWGVEILVERAAEGPSLKQAGERKEEGILRLLEDLARLHTIEGEQWHKPWHRKQGFENAMTYWEDRLERFRERITPETSGLEPSEIEAGLRLTREGLAAAARHKPVAVYGDVSLAHAYLHSDGGLTWIDLETVHFSRPEEDLAAVARMLKGFAGAEFIEKYEAAGARKVDREALRTFSLLLHWERLNSRVQQLRRRHGKKAEGKDHKGRKVIHKLQNDQRVSERAICRLIHENPFLVTSSGKPASSQG